MHTYRYIQIHTDTHRYTQKEPFAFCHFVWLQSVFPGSFFATAAAPWHLLHLIQLFLAADILFLFLTCSTGLWVAVFTRDLHVAFLAYHLFGGSDWICSGIGTRSFFAFLPWGHLLTIGLYNFDLVTFGIHSDSVAFPDTVYFTPGNFHFAPPTTALERQAPFRILGSPINLNWWQTRSQVRVVLATALSTFLVEADITLCNIGSQYQGWGLWTIHGVRWSANSAMGLRLHQK